jgi:hypothetical protein
MQPTISHPLNPQTAEPKTNHQQLALTERAIEAEAAFRRQITTIRPLTAPLNPDDDPLFGEQIERLVRRGCVAACAAFDEKAAAPERTVGRADPKRELLVKHLRFRMFDLLEGDGKRPFDGNPMDARLLAAAGARLGDALDKALGERRGRWEQKGWVLPHEPHQEHAYAAGDLADKHPVTRRRKGRGKTSFDDPMAGTKELVRKMYEEGCSQQQMCERLWNSPRPPHAGWRDLPWPQAYRQHPGPVKKWLSNVCRSCRISGR